MVDLEKAETGNSIHSNSNGHSISNRPGASRIFSAQHLDDYSTYHGQDSVVHEPEENEESEGSEFSQPVTKEENQDFAEDLSGKTTGVGNRVPSMRDVEAPLEKRSSAKSVKARDPNLVTWDGPDDPENPKNWSTKRRWAATVVVSSFTFISPVSSSMVAPAIQAIAGDLDITNEVESQMVLSIFVLAYAVGPLFLGPLSEVYGRVPVLQLANLFYLVFNTAAGGCRTKSEMIAFRFLSGLGGSAPLAVGGGVLSDCWRAEQRGRAISIYSLAPLLGPAIGPIAGGFITERTTWRWAFYATSIADALIQLSGLFFLRETYPPKLLHLKKLRLIKETGNQDLHTEYDDSSRSLIEVLEHSIIRPFRLLGTQPIVQVLAVYAAYLYGLMYLVLSTFPVLWTQRYHQSVGIAGLNYISMGVGFTLGAQIFAPLNDRCYRILKARNGGTGKPEFRIPIMVPGSALVPVGLFIYAWTAQCRTHWIGPNVGIAVFSCGAIAASAIAASTVLRSLAGFGFPLFAPYMYQKLDYGWGNTLLALIAVALGLPAPFALWVWGERLRERSPFAAGGGD